MILIADSGSTKTNWGIIHHEGKPFRFTTEGVNPFFRTTSDILSEWEQSPLNGLSGKPERIYFYGAGIIDREKANLIKNALKSLFPDAEMYVGSDLLGAARATLGEKSGITCILGTGSNSCLYNGKKITAHVPPLGFILGDEGSGAVMGKQLISDYLKNWMPEQLRTKFKNKYPLNYAEILNQVYHGEKPNHFLAGFVPFLKLNIDHEYCNQLVEKAFHLFLERNIAHYAEFNKMPICFVGSVAFHFQKQLKNVFLKQNLIPHTIIQDPMENLLAYHT
ncbi:MAG: ATPase [Mariniphaga sp.]|nr:ATPase [Mariniphaga sp.]MDD4426586.1 ATPase [Mariniphaga sp.]